MRPWWPFHRPEPDVIDLQPAVDAMFEAHRRQIEIDIEIDRWLRDLDASAPWYVRIARGHCPPEEKGS